MNSRVDGEGGEELRPGDGRWNHRLKAIVVPETQKLNLTYCSGLFMLLRPVVLLDRNASSSFLEPHQNTTLPKKPSDSFFFVYIIH